MFNEMQNFLTEAEQSLLTVPHSSSSLISTLMIMWSFVLSVTFVMVMRIIYDDPKRIITRQLLWFNFVVALFGWVTSRTWFISPDFFEDCPKPFVGMVAAFAISATPLLAMKLQKWESLLLSRLVVPFCITILSLALSHISFELSLLPPSILLRQLGVLLLIFLACLSCSYIFSRLALKYQLWGEKEHVSNKEIKSAGDD